MINILAILAVKVFFMKIVFVFFFHYTYIRKMNDPKGAKKKFYIHIINK
jgi:hypothetical protein